MKRLIWNIIAGVVLVTAGSAEAYEGTFSFDANIGLREDSLNYNIADPSGTPNVAEERKWNRVKSIYFGADIDYRYCDFLVAMHGGYGTIYSGTTNNRTWSDDDRTTLATKVTALCDRGEVFDASLGFGKVYPICLKSMAFEVTPMFGYSRQAQHLRQKDGAETFPAAVPIAKLKNLYQTQWYGPWLGFSIAHTFKCLFDVTGGFEWHFGTLRVRAQDQQGDPITSFTKFIQKSYNTHGPRVYFGARYDFWRCYKVGFIADYQEMRTSGGRQWETNTFPPPITTAKSRLNQVNWRVWKVLGTLGVDY